MNQKNVLFDCTREKNLYLYHFILAVIKNKYDIDKIIAYIDNNLSNQRKKAI